MLEPVSVEAPLVPETVPAIGKLLSALKEIKILDFSAADNTPAL